MSTLLRLMMVAFLIITSVVSAEAQKKAKETVDETISRLQVEPEGETNIERRKRLRALEILQDKQEKKSESQRKKTLTPAELQADREIDKEEKRDKKSIDHADKAFYSVNLIGCEHQNLWVNPAIGNSWGLRKSFNQSMVFVTITNMSDGPIDITSSLHGLLINGLCAGGTLTLTFASRHMGPIYTQFTLTALMKGKSGTVAEHRSLSLYNNKYSDPQVNSEVWEVFRGR